MGALLDSLVTMILIALGHTQRQKLPERPNTCALVLTQHSTAPDEPLRKPETRPTYSSVVNCHDRAIFYDPLTLNGYFQQFLILPETKMQTCD
jgi:hypothetical protein